MKKNYIIGVLGFIFTMLAFVLVFIFQYLMRTEFGLPYSKKLTGISFIILLSFGLGVASILVLQSINKRITKGKE